MWGSKLSFRAYKYIYLSLCLLTYLSLCLSTNLSVYLCIYLSACLSLSVSSSPFHRSPSLALVSQQYPYLGIWFPWIVFSLSFVFFLSGYMRNFATMLFFIIYLPVFLFPLISLFMCLFSRFLNFYFFVLPLLADDGERRKLLFLLFSFFRCVSSLSFNFQSNFFHFYLYIYVLVIFSWTLSWL